MQYGDEIAVTDSEKKITYLELNQKAICIGQYEFEVVGLLANGSNRSKLCADFYHVPLYTQIEDIPEVDIACVVIRSRAVGGSGTDI